MTSDTSSEHALLQYEDIDTYSGQRGSAIYTSFDGQLTIVGVHTDGFHDFNQGTAITPATLKWIRHVISECASDKST